MDTPSFWRKCTTCKKPIQFNQTYWICSVSTCNRVRTDLVFCDLKCFDAHVPVLNHRDAGAFERKAPRTAEIQKASPAVEASTPQPRATKTSPDEQEILVVVSKMKAYIKSKSGMNTSDAVADAITRFIKKWANEAIENAKKSGRQTVMDRDIF